MANNVSSATDDKDWAYGTEGDWCIKGIDPFWFGRRYPDGRHDAFKDVPDGQQQVCYNETDCKINWQYLRLLIDTEKREYVEMQCQDKTIDLERHPIYTTEYSRWGTGRYRFLRKQPFAVLWAEGWRRL